MRITFLHKGIFFLAGFLFIASCTELIDIELDNSLVRLAVYGEITTDTAVHTIHLTRTADYFYNLPAQGVSDAIVKISDGITETLLSENPLKPGFYETDPDFFGLPGKTYALSVENTDINMDGEKESYYATSFLPFQARLDSIGFKYASYPFFKGGEILLYAQDPAETIDFYAFKVIKNRIQQTDSLPEIIAQSDLLFNGNYTFGISVQYLDDAKPGERVTPGDTIGFEMYGITQEYYKFIIEAQTELFGSNPLFSGPPANISTNLSPPALGFFAASNVLRAMIIVPEKQ